MIDIEKFLEKYYKKNDKIILACSTGPDSMFLLYKILKTKYKKNLIVCHFNHKTRVETDREEEFIKQIGKKEKFKVEITKYDFKNPPNSLNKEEQITKKKKLQPLVNNISSNKDLKQPFVKNISPNKGLQPLVHFTNSFEELAREKRYTFFRNIKKKYNAKYIITAHHLDDKIETFYFNLNRGSKLSGLINMTEISLDILRPILNIKKSEILDYLNKNNLKYFIDKSNFDINISRNYLRHEIIPKFEKINKNFKQNISKTLNYFENLKEFIDEEVKKFLDSFLISNNHSSNKKFFEIKSFNLLSNFLQKEVIRYIYYISNNNSTIGLSEANINEIIKFINGKNNKTIKEIKNLKMKKDNNLIIY